MNRLRGPRKHRQPCGGFHLNHKWTAAGLCARCGLPKPVKTSLPAAPEVPALTIEQSMQLLAARLATEVRSALELS